MYVMQQPSPMQMGGMGGAPYTPQSQGQVNMQQPLLPTASPVMYVQSQHPHPHGGGGHHH